MRRNPDYQQQPEEQQNFSKLIEQVDRMQSEETKIMTFKSQDNGFYHQQDMNQNQRFSDGPDRVNQT